MQTSSASLPPLQLKDCDAVCSVMGGTSARQSDAAAPTVPQNKTSVTRAELPTSITQRKQVVYAANPSRLYYSPPEDSNPSTLLQMINGGSKVLVPASTTKLDENGNALRDANDTTAPRSKKKHKDKSLPTSRSEDCEGFRGREELTSLLHYIEGGAPEASSHQGKQQAKQKRSKDALQQQQQEAMGRRSQRHSEESSESSKKGAKTKERSQGGRNKMKRSSSMEERSRTKMEDLMAPPESSSSVGDGRMSQACNSEDDSADDMESQQDIQNGNVASYKRTINNDDISGFKEDFYSVIEPSSQHTKDGEEFHVVTKKQRRRKQRSRQDDHLNRHTSGYQRRGEADEDDDSSLNSGFTYRMYHSQKDRRKCKSASSMPPSDQSGGESSDLDSRDSSEHEHPLRASSATNKTAMDKTYGSSGSTPPASYADITRASVPADLPTNNFNKTSTPKQQNNKNYKNNNGQAESWDEWPQVSNKSVSSQTQQDMVKRDAMTSTCIENVPLQVTASHPAVSITSTSSVSSISPASSTISSSNATEPNTPPEEATRVNVLNDFPPLIPSFSEHSEKRKVDEIEPRKSTEIEQLCENNNPPPLSNNIKNKNSVNKNQIIIDELKQNELNSTETLKHTSILPNNTVMVNGVDHFVQEKVLKFTDYKARTSSSITKPPAFVCNSNPHNQQAPQQQQALTPAQLLSAANPLHLQPQQPQQQQQPPLQESQQPAVILLNETQKSDSNFDITFGFEINELLLAQVEPIELPDDEVKVMSDSATQAQDKPSPVPESVVPTSPTQQQLSSSSDPTLSQSSRAVLAVAVVEQSCITATEAGPTADPVVSSPPLPQQKTKDFAAMFRASTLPDPLTYNSSEIVDFVGQAWEKTLKELNSGHPIEFFSRV